MPEQLVVTFDRQGDRHTMSLRGELDMATAEQLQRGLQSVCAEGARRITLDLREVTFVDSAGLRAILDGQRFCAEHGCRYFLIRSVHHAPNRLFDIAGVQDELRFVEAGERRRDRPRAPRRTAKNQPVSGR